jgi:hypothetical protein
MHLSAPNTIIRYGSLLQSGKIGKCMNIEHSAKEPVYTSKSRNNFFMYSGTFSDDVVLH